MSDLITGNREMFRYDIVWNKQKYTGFLNAKKMPLRAHESICVFYRRLPTYNPQKYYRDIPSWRGKGQRGSLNYDKFHDLDSTGSKDGLRYPLSVIYVDYEADFFKKIDPPCIRRRSRSA